MTIRSATILLVDDEELIRVTLHEYLSDMGYDVITASNGGDALSVVDRPVVIDLIITDIRMPGNTDGFQLIDYAKRRRPQTRMIAMSGFVGNHGAKITTADSFLSKPFTFMALERGIERLLH